MNRFAAVIVVDWTSTLYSIHIGNYTWFGKDGTSYSAPMVTGVAALVWSINPAFSALEVKRMVCDDTGSTAKGYLPLDTKTYNMLNAYTSVRKAIQKVDSNGITNSISGYVKDASNGNAPLAGVTVTVYDQSNKNITSTTTNTNGDYYLALPEGSYKIYCTKADYNYGNAYFTLYSSGYELELDTIYMSRM